MTYFDAFKSGNLVLPSALLLHFKELFPSSDDFLVWQFFYLQNTSALDELSPSQIAETIGKGLADVNQSISNLTENGLLQYRTIELNGEIELIFDAVWHLNAWIACWIVTLQLQLPQIRKIN